MYKKWVWRKKKIIERCPMENYHYFFLRDLYVYLYTDIFKRFRKLFWSGKRNSGDNMIENSRKFRFIIDPRFDVSRTT